MYCTLAKWTFDIKLHPHVFYSFKFVFRMTEKYSIINPLAKYAVHESMHGKTYQLNILFSVTQPA